LLKYSFRLTRTETGKNRHKFHINIEFFFALLESFENFKIGRQVIRTVKYADDLVLLAKEETVLQGMVDSFIEVGRCYGMKMNVEETNVMKIST
jgi:hypothetical protein